MSRQLTLTRYGNGFEIGRPDDLTVRELRTWSRFRGELLARAFGARSVAVAELSWSGTPPLAPILTDHPAESILDGAFWLTLLTDADPGALRQLGADSANWGGELWVIGSASVDTAETFLRSIADSFAPGADAPAASCEAMATVFDDHAVWWLAPEQAAEEVREVVSGVASSIGWRVR